MSRQTENSAEMTVRVAGTPSSATPATSAATANPGAERLDGVRRVRSRIRRVVREIKEGQRINMADFESLVDAIHGVDAVGVDHVVVRVGNAMIALAVFANSGLKIAQANLRIADFELGRLADLIDEHDL